LATRKWDRESPKFGVFFATCTLNGGDTGVDLKMPDYSDKTVHIFGGTFGNSAVSVKGLNDTDGTAQDLHRVNDPTLTFSSLTSETFGLVLENPLIIRVSASGTTGVGLKVVIVGKRNI